jgi:hypothetical protein
VGVAEDDAGREECWARPVRDRSVAAWPPLARASLAASVGTAEADVEIGVADARDGENEDAAAFLVGWALPLEARWCELPAPFFLSFLFILLFLFLFL